MRRTWPFVAAVLLAALALAAFVGPFASKAPDGLDKVAADRGFGFKERDRAAPMAGYQVPFGGDKRLSTGMAGAAGTLAVFAVGFGLAKLAARGKETA